MQHFLVFFFVLIFPFQCDYCHEGFHNLSNFNKHKNLYGPQIQKWICLDCGEFQSTKYNSKMHYQRHHAKNEFGMEDMIINPSKYKNLL